MARTASLVWVALGVLLLPLSAAAEFQVNTYTTDYQERPAVASDADGDFVVVWHSYYQSPDEGFGVFGQRYDSAGAAIGSEFRVNTYTEYDQLNPSVSSDADGDFIVVWQDYDDGAGFGIAGQRFNSGGSAVGTEFQVNTYTTYSQRYPVVASDLDGDFVVIWYGTTGSGAAEEVFGQRFSSNGNPNGSEFAVNTYTTFSQRFPAVAAEENGAFVVVWEGTGDGDSFGIFGQRFDSDGSSLGSEFMVNTYTTFGQRLPSVSADGDGDFVVVWRREDDDEYGVFGQRFDSDGGPVGTEFQVNTYTYYSQTRPRVASDGNGDFVVVWSSFYQFSNGVDIVGQRFDSAGSLVGTEFQVNTDITEYHYNLFPAVASDADGEFVVVWQNYTGDPGYDIFAQRGVPPPPQQVDCPAVPDGTCTTGFGKGFLLVSEKVAGKEKVIAKFIGGPSISQAGFGNPLVNGGTAYRLCVYNSTPSLVATLVVDRAGDMTCSGGAAVCWKSIGAAPPAGKGYKYKDKDFSADGVFQILLKGGTSAKIIVKGRGPTLPLPIAAGLTATTSVTVQLRGDDAPAPGCVSVTLSDVKKQDADYFKAK